MYCPDCGTLNDARPSYCRKCGRSLVGVNLALEGRVEEAIAKFKKSEDLLATGLLIFGIFLIGAVIMLFLEGPRPFSFSVLLGLIICLPIVLMGLIKIDRVRRLLDRAEAEPKRLPATNELNALPARETDPLEISPKMRGSVTDRTTLHLDQRKPKIASD